MEDEWEIRRKQMQWVMADLYEKQQQALERICPQCYGPLKIKDICAVTCPDCLLVFSVDEILANPLNKQD